MKLQLTSIIRMAVINSAVVAVLCSCSGSAAEDAVNEVVAQNAEEVVKSVSTKAASNGLTISVNTNKSVYTTTLKNVESVKAELTDTIVIASQDDAVPYTYYLSNKGEQLKTWNDGNFRHTEVLKSYVVCFADGQAAKLNFKQDNVSFKSAQELTPSLNETAPVLVSVEEVMGSDTDEYATYTYTYEMTVCYEGAEAQTLVSKVVVLQQKEAISFSGSVAEYNDYETGANA